jgi:hypothetical protein
MFRIDKAIETKYKDWRRNKQGNEEWSDKNELNLGSDGAYTTV